MFPYLFLSLFSYLVPLLFYLEKKKVELLRFKGVVHQSFLLGSLFCLSFKSLFLVIVLFYFKLFLAQQ